MRNLAILLVLVVGCISPMTGSTLPEKAVIDVDIYFYEALGLVMGGHWAHHETLGNEYAIRISRLNSHVELFNVFTGGIEKLDWLPTPHQMTAHDWLIIRSE